MDIDDQRRGFIAIGQVDVEHVAFGLAVTHVLGVLGSYARQIDRRCCVAEFECGPGFYRIVGIVVAIATGCQHAQCERVA
jgi:hypothetical protein